MSYVVILAWLWCFVQPPIPRLPDWAVLSRRAALWLSESAGLTTMLFSNSFPLETKPARQMAPPALIEPFISLGIVSTLSD